MRTNITANDNRRNAPMTSKERMLTAYRNQEPDRVPVAPELWYLIPAKLVGKPFNEIDVATWELQLRASRYFGCDGWVCPTLGILKYRVEVRSFTRTLHNRALEKEKVYLTSKKQLTEREVHPSDAAPWKKERCIKDFFSDLDAFEEVHFVDPADYDLSQIQRAMEATGEEGIVEVIIGGSFSDFLGQNTQGGYQQVIYSLIDYPDYFEVHQERYKSYLRRETEVVLKETRPDALFMGGSSLSLMNPKMWRKWDKSVIETVIEAAHRFNTPVHVHVHGRCMEIIQDLVEIEADILSPLEPPPGGDVTDLAKIKKKYGNKLALKGNVHTIEVMLHGAPDDVRHRVKGCIASAAEGGGFVLSTGDQVSNSTPFGNIKAFVEAGKEYGRYPLGLHEKHRERGSLQGIEKGH